MGIANEPQFHVLAVDDSLIDRKLIERLLKTSSYQVTTVNSGSKALEFLGLQEDEVKLNQHSVSHQEVEVNLIISDYCMPGMTGYDLLKKVKESSAFRNIPVVIMSSENVPSRIDRCLEDGAEEFFLKPVRRSDVNRLRPHMLRAKYGQHRQDLLHECQKADPKPAQQKPNEQQQQQQCEQEPEQKTEEQQQCEQEPEQNPEEEQQQCEQEPEQKPEEEQEKNKKRKSMDEGVTGDRTRPRYNDIITTMV